MKIMLATHSGFCMGVKNAVLRIINELGDKKHDIHVYGPLIHNPQTIEILQLRGLKTLSTLDDIEGKQLAIRSHGVPVEEYRLIKSKADRVINLTCPRVAKVQSIIKKYSDKGYYTIIIGDRDHAEVDGLKSYAAGGYAIVSTMDDLSGIPDRDSYIVVAQTTAERQFFIEAIDALGKKFSNLEIIDTICDSTRLRQQDVLSGIRSGVDTIVVVGGKNSANTKRLVQIGERNGIKTVFVETADGIDERDFASSERVLVTAGASTPGWIINSVMERLYEIHFRKTSMLLYRSMRLVELIIKTNIISSIGAFFLTGLVYTVAGYPVDFSHATISLLYVFSMYTINNYLEKNSLKISNPYKYRIYERYGRILLLTALAATAGMFIIGSDHGIIPNAILLLSFAVGGIYSSGPVKRIIKWMNLRFIRGIYNSRVFTCFGWLIVTIAIPVLEAPVDPPAAVLVGAYAFALLLMRHLLIDKIAFQGDLILGRETMAILIGRKAQSALFILLAVASLSAVLAATVCIGPWYSLFGINIVYYLALFFNLAKKDFVASLKYEVIVEANLLLMAFFTLLSIRLYTH
jgi:(E)-4-hydroxy-3-methyl-but-2-enyl pyrophosphate reductase